MDSNIIDVDFGGAAETTTNATESDEVIDVSAIETDNVIPFVTGMTFSDVASEEATYEEEDFGDADSPPVMEEALDELTQTRKEKISQMARYRGEIATKSMLRKLPHLTVGEIFWVTNDKMAYIVSEKGKNKVGLKPLDENATISTGYTLYDMNKAAASREPIHNFNDPIANEVLMTDLQKYFREDTSAACYLMFSHGNSYFTLFQCDNHEDPDIGQVIECIGHIGRLISIDRDANLGEFEALEIWIRTDTSKAELFYLFPFDDAIVKL